MEVTLCIKSIVSQSFEEGTQFGTRIVPLTNRFPNARKGVRLEIQQETLRPLNETMAGVRFSRQKQPSFNETFN